MKKIAKSVVVEHTVLDPYTFVPMVPITVMVSLHIVEQLPGLADRDHAAQRLGEEVITACEERNNRVRAALVNHE